MYAEDQDGNVVITLNRQDYDSLLLCLGYAIGGATKDNALDIANVFLRLANTVNQGNPDWRPYATTPTEAIH